ncbi:NADH-dependent flavin oxidoreductase, partial [Salmonella enterica subsp. enterica serovar Enteritidis]
KLADKPLDYLHISLRSYNQVSVLDKYKEKSILAYVHEQINGRVPLVGVGGILTSEDANETLNHSEFFALGNAILMDPHWVSKAINGEDELIRTRVTNYDLEEQLIPDGALGTMKDEYFK